MSEALVISEIFKEAASKFRDDVALQSKKDTAWEKFTYQQIQDLSLRVGAFLIRQGLKRGDFVALILENRPEWAVIYFGIIHAGLTCVPLDPELSEYEIENLINDCQAKVIFTGDEIFLKKNISKLKPRLKIVILDLEKEEENLIAFSSLKFSSLDTIAWPLVLPEDIASLIYTSGTTGKPKGVLLSHRNICANFASIKETNICSSADNFLSLLPLYHGYAFMVTLIVPLFLGAKVTYCPSFKAEDLARIIQEAGVSVLVGVPQLFSLLHKTLSDKLKNIPFYFRPFILPFFKAALHRRLGRLRILVSGGARLEPKISRELARLGLPLIEGYGLTETSPVVTFNPLEKIKFGSVGKPVRGVEIKIINPDKSGIGQVLIKGPNVMPGYFKQPELTAQAIKNGWFYSGDMGYIDKEGYLFLVGREKEVMVLSSGKNIYPEELEDYYCRSPYIKEICILLRQEKAFGYLKDSLYAVIVPNLEYFTQKKETNIREKIRWDLETLGRNLAPYKHIMGFTLSKENLPRTALRKIKRFAVRDKYLQEKRAAAKVTEGELCEEEVKILNKDIAQKIIQYISKQINKPVYLGSHLEIDLGIDSLTRVELGLGLEARLKIKIPDELLYNLSTIKDLIINLENLIESSQGRVEKIEQKSWPEILRQAPPQEILKKIKLDFGPYEAALTWLFKKMFLFIFRVFWFLRIEGKENLPRQGPYLICPNHASYLDGLFIFSSLPFATAIETYFLGYQRIFAHPMLAWTNKIARLLSINVDLHLAEAMQAVAFVLSHKKAVCIFPEGMRSIDTEVKEFKKGVGILARELDVPLVPVYIQGSHYSWPRGSRLPRFYPVKVIFGQMKRWQELGNDDEAIARGLREEVLKLIEIGIRQ